MVDTLVDQTGGNPLALIEIARTLDDAQAAGVRPLPRRLAHTRAEEAYAARVAGLTDPERQAARLAALAGEAPRDVLLAALAHCGLDLDRLRPVEDRGLVEVDDRVRWPHPLARNAASHGSAAERIACHAALADAWAATQPTNPARAWHLAESVTGSDRGASDVLRAAADLAAGRGAWADAADAYERAARLQPDHHQQTDLLTAAGDAAGRAGEPRRAAGLLDEALDLTDDPPDALLLARATLEKAVGTYASARAWLERVLDASRDPAVRVRAATEAIYWSGFEGSAVPPALVDIVRAEHDPEDPSQLFLFHFSEANLAHRQGKPDEARRHARRAHEHLATHKTLISDPSLLWLATFLELPLSGRSPIHAHETEAIRAARRSGNLLDLVPALCYTTLRLDFSGEFAGSLENWREVEMLARMAGMPLFFLAAAANLAETDADAGRAEDARARIDEMRAWRRRNSSTWGGRIGPVARGVPRARDGQAGTRRRPAQARHG